MKQFKEYLVESKKKYALRIKLGFKPEKSLINQIQLKCDKWDSNKIGDFSSEIVRKSDPYFPGCENPEIWHTDVEFNYPVTADMLQKAISDISGIEKKLIAVVSKEYNDSINSELESISTNTEKDKPLLMRDFENHKAEQTYGDSYNEKLIKNSVSGTGKVKVKGGPIPAETTNDLKQGTKSPLGSHKPKFVPVTGGVR